MYGISHRAFRLLVLIALICMLVSLGVSHGLLAFDPAVENARRWHYFGLILPMWSVRIYSTAWMASVISGLIGIMFYWWPSRWLLAASIAASLIIRPFLGLAVASASETFCGGLFWFLTLLVTSISFFSPLANKFSRGSRGRAP